MKRASQDYKHEVNDVHTYAVFARIAYLNRSFLSDYGARQKIIPADWELIESKKLPHFKIPPSSSIGASSALISKLFSNPHTCFVFLSEKRKEIIITLNGTVPSNMSDLKADLLIAKGKGYCISEEIEKFINDTIETVQEPNYKITLIGHSLGGYLVSKLLFHIKPKAITNFDILAIAFDSPGFEDLFLHNADTNSELSARIHTFVFKPHLINCVNYHIGRMFHLPLANSRVQASISDIVKNIFHLEKDGTIMADIFFKKMVAPVTAMAFNKLPLPIPKINTDTIIAFRNNINAVIEISSEWKEKLRETLERHEISSFIIQLTQHKNITIKEIDKKTWPTLQFLSTNAPTKWDEQIKYIGEQPLPDTFTYLPSFFQKNNQNLSSQGHDENIQVAKPQISTQNQSLGFWNYKQYNQRNPQLPLAFLLTAGAVFFGVADIKIVIFCLAVALLLINKLQGSNQSTPRAEIQTPGNRL